MPVNPVDPIGPVNPEEGADPVARAAAAAAQNTANAAVPANTPITGATKTKVTYDAKGLVTGGADATTADIADSTDKRYVTDNILAGHLPGSLIVTGTITGVTSAITGTKGTALTLSVPTRGADDAAGVGLNIAADAGGSGGTGNHNGGDIVLTPGAGAGTGTVGKAKVGSNVIVTDNRAVNAGTGLSGGGDLSADRTLAVSFGSAAGTSAQGNDGRFWTLLPSCDYTVPVGGVLSTDLPVVGANFRELLLTIDFTFAAPPKNCQIYLQPDGSNTNGTLWQANGTVAATGAPRIFGQISVNERRILFCRLVMNSAGTYFTTGLDGCNNSSYVVAPAPATFLRVSQSDPSNEKFAAGSRIQLFGRA